MNTSSQHWTLQLLFPLLWIPWLCSRLPLQILLARVHTIQTRDLIRYSDFYKSPVELAWMGKIKKENISLFRITGSQQRDIGLQGCMQTSASVHFPPIYSKLSGKEWENNERRPRVTTFHHPSCLCMTKAGHISVRTSRSLLHAC